MEIQQLQSFSAAAQTLNFNLAAAQLFIDQSTLSRRISLLEKDLGVTLFERGKNYSGVKLTSAGELLLPRIQSVLEQLDNVRSLAQQLQNNGRVKNTLMIGLDSRIIFTDIPNYLSQYPLHRPGCKISFYHTEATELFRWLRARVVDVGVAIHIPKEPIDGLDIQVLEKLSMCLAVHTNVLQALGTDDPADILRVKPLYFNGVDEEGISHSLEVARSMGTTPNVIRCRNHLEVMTYVNAGQGVNICYQQNTLPGAEIVMLPIPRKYGELPLYGLLPTHNAAENAKAFLADYSEYKKQNN